MTVTAKELEMIEQHLRPLVGQYVRQSTFGADDTLRLDLVPRLFPRRDDLPEHGPTRLWVLDAMWRLQTEAEVLIGSGDRGSKREVLLQRLDGRMVEALEVLPPGLEAVITFAGGFVLLLFPVHTRRYVHWALLTPDGHTVEIGPGTTWSYRTGAGPDASISQEADETSFS